MPRYQIWMLISPLIFRCRPAFRDIRCFYWAFLIIMAFCTGIGRNAGVSGIARTLDLAPYTYTSLLGFFFSAGIFLDKLHDVWLKTLLKMTSPIKLGKYVLFAVDEIKIGKEGKKMPAVKYTHQSSSDNSKPDYFMAHNITVFGLMTKGILGNVAAMPILSRILGGIRRTPKDKKSFLDYTVTYVFKLVSSLGEFGAIFVADALYCVYPFIKPLLANGIHIISRVRKNGVACFPAPPPVRQKNGKNKRGRKKKYGEKVHFSEVFNDVSTFKKIASPIPGETCTIRYRTINLLPDWLGILVKYVLVDHPNRGKIILLCTNISMAPMDVYLAYYYRFQIEQTFKSLVHTIGAFSYRFWSKTMKKLKRREKTRYIHREPDLVRSSIDSKLQAYHVYITLACIACCIVQFLSLYHPEKIWGNFSGWRRTLRTNNAPSIEIAAEVLKDGLFEFFASKKMDPNLAKFLDQKRDLKKKKTKRFT